MPQQPARASQGEITFGRVMRGIASMVLICYGAKVNKYREYPKINIL
jgi:hypothetical protein